MTIKDMKQAVKLLSKECNLGKKEAGADNDICAWIYLLDVLQESEKKNKLISFIEYVKNDDFDKANNCLELYIDKTSKLNESYRKTYVDDAILQGILLNLNEQKNIGLDPDRVEDYKEYKLKDDSKKK